MIYYFALSISLLIWGFNYIPIKIALEDVHPFELAFLTSSIAAATLWMIRGPKTIRTIKQTKHYKKLIGTGIFGTFGFNFFFNFGMRDTSSVNASLIIATLPVYGLILGWLSHDEKITPLKTFGVVLSLIGVGLLSLGGSDSFQTLEFNPGDLLVLIATLSLSVHISIVKHLRTHYDPVSITTCQLTLAALLFLPLAWSQNLLQTIQSLSGLVWASVLFVAIVRSTIANNLYGYAVKHLSMTVATVSSNFIPFITAFFAWLILGESLLFIQIVSGLFIIFGVISTSGMIKNQKRPSTDS